MTFLFFTFGLWEILFAVGFFSWLFVATVWDRNYKKPDQKWWSLGLLVIVLAAYATLSKDPKDGWSLNWAWLNLSFFFALGKYALYYLGAGVLYSVIEFYYEMKRSQKYFAERWEDFKVNKGIWVKVPSDSPAMSPEKKGQDVTQSFNYWAKSIGADGKSPEYVSVVREKLVDAVDSFCYTYSKWDRPVKIRPDEENPLLVVPGVDAAVLAPYVGAWVVFWPFYGLSLVLTDFLAQLWRGITNALIRAFSGVLKRIFDGTFKV